MLEEIGSLMEHYLPSRHSPTPLSTTLLSIQAKLVITYIAICIAPINIHLPYVHSLAKPHILTSAQNVSAYNEGAYTGEITAKQLKDIGINWSIIGHSERRNIFGESDSIIGIKQKHLQNAGMNSILCIGEKLNERESNKTWEVCERQLEAARPNIIDWKKVVIAYEPVWAIGTGKTASPEQAEEVHCSIREWVKRSVSEEVSSIVQIIYGGSVTEKNASELIRQRDIDGFLVGGASLKAGFKDIVDACSKSNK